MMHFKLLFRPIIATAKTHDCTFNDAFWVECVCVCVLYECAPQSYLNEILSAQQQLGARCAKRTSARCKQKATLWAGEVGVFCLIIISRHTSLWHYYNDCCSKIHHAPDSNTHCEPVRVARNLLWANVLPAVGILPLVEKQTDRQTVGQTDRRQTDGQIDRQTDTESLSLVQG